MITVCVEEQDKTKEFAERAAEDFAENSKHYTFTDSTIEAGCLFALRFGLNEDCVVVFRLDENFEPINYQQLIGQSAF